jgi:hypothetical protein
MAFWHNCDTNPEYRSLRSGFTSSGNRPRGDSPQTDRLVSSVRFREAVGLLRIQHRTWFLSADP